MNTLIGPVAKGSILHTQRKRFGTTTMNNNAQSTSTSYTLQSSQLTKVNDQSQNSEKVIQHSTTTSPSLQQSSQSKEITYHSPGNNTTEHFTAKSPSLQSSQSYQVTDHLLDPSPESIEHFTNGGLNLLPKQSNDLSIIFFPNLLLRNLEEKVDLNFQ